MAYGQDADAVPLSRYLRKFVVPLIWEKSLANGPINMGRFCTSRAKQRASVPDDRRHALAVCHDENPVPRADRIWANIQDAPASDGAARRRGERGANGRMLEAGALV